MLIVNQLQFQMFLKFDYLQTYQTHKNTVNINDDGGDEAEPKLRMKLFGKSSWVNHLQIFCLIPISICYIHIFAIKRAIKLLFVDP